MKKPSLLFLLKTLICLPFVWIFVVVLNDNFLLLPRTSFRGTPRQNGAIVLPQENLVRTAASNLPWRIVSDNFSWNVHIPYRVQALQTEVNLQNRSQLSIFFSAKTIPSVGDRVSLVFSSVLNELSWNKSVPTDTLTFWQRPSRDVTIPAQPATRKKLAIPAKTVTVPVQQYPTFHDWQTGQPDLARAGVIGLDPFAFATVPDYHPTESLITIEHAFRGDHDLYVYAGHENINLQFQAASLGRKKGVDRVIVRIGKLDQPTGVSWNWLATTTVTLPEKDGKNLVPSTITLDAPVHDEGMYLIQIRAGDDVVWRNLTTSQHYLNFRRIHLAEGQAYGWSPFTPAILTTNGTTLTFSADHEPGYQDLKIAGRMYHLNQMHEEQSAALTGATTVTVNKPDARFRTDGLIAVGPTQLIPTVPMVEVNPGNPNLDMIDYLIAAYHVPPDPRHLVINQTYAVDELALDSDNQVTFTLAMPDLRKNDALLGLTSVKATLIRGSFPWAKVRTKITGLLN